MSERIRIVGLDPGSRLTGFAVLEAPSRQVYRPADFRVVDAGILKPSGQLSLIERIGHMHEALYELLAQWQAHFIGIEKAFVGVNAASAIKLGEARGALMTAARRHRLPIFEMTPNQVKKTVTGAGHAEKKQVSLALRTLIQFEHGHLPFDVSDAVAIALTLGLSLHGLLPAPSSITRKVKTHDATR